RYFDFRYGMAESVAAFAQAVRLDPEFAQAHAWVATQLTLMYLADQKPDTIREAEEHARRALAIDGHDASAHEAMGWVNLRKRQFDRAREHFDRAVALNPQNVIIAIVPIS